LPSSVICISYGTIWYDTVWWGYPDLTSATIGNGWADSLEKKNIIRLTVVHTSAVRSLETALEGQTDSVKKNRIRLAVVHLSTARSLGTALDGQTDK
jgi:hypothetical protein